MNYRKVYIKIISNAKKEELEGKRKKGGDTYYERHHILPKCIFPLWSKRKSNMVLLTAREHFFCHALLTKIWPCIPIFAAYVCFKDFKNNKFRILSSRQYEAATKYKKEVCSFAGKKYNISKEELSAIRSKAAKEYWDNLKGSELQKRKEILYNINSTRVCSELSRQTSRDNMNKLNSQYSFDKRSIASKKGWENKSEEQRKKDSELKSIRMKAFMQTADEKFKETHRLACKQALGKRIRCLNDNKSFLAINDAVKYYYICKKSIRKSILLGIPVTKKKLIFIEEQSK